MVKGEMTIRLVLIMFGFGGMLGISSLAYTNWSMFFTGLILLFPFIIYLINFYFKTKRRRITTNGGK